MEKLNSVLSIPIFFEKVANYESQDTRFTMVKIYMMHTGINENDSDFSKEVITAAIPSLQYIPIVGFIKQNSDKEDDFSNHKYIIVKDENGLRRKYIGHAYGVVKSSDDNNAHFEMRTCDDGVEREFLVVDGLIWNQFEDSAEIMNRDLIKSHSMELLPESCEGYEDENGIFHFTSFSFRAACIIGKDYEPAMINSTIEVQFTMSDFVKSIQSELNDRYTTFSKVIDNTNKGGKGQMANNKNDFTLSTNQLFGELSNVVSSEKFRDRWGDEVSRYCLVDIQDNEVIVVDRQNNYQYYGMKYTMKGDKAEVDFNSAVRKKIVYENFEDGETEVVNEDAFNFADEIKRIEDTAFTKIEDANNNLNKANEEKAKATSEYEKAKTDYDTVKAELDDIKPKYEEYVAKDEKRIADETEAKKNECFLKFDDYLSDVAEYQSLKDKRDDKSVEEIEQECCVMYAKKDISLKTEFTKNNDGGSGIGVMDNTLDDSLNDDYVETRYGKIKKSK